MRTIKNVTLASNKSGNKLFVQRGSAGSYQEDFSPDSMDKAIKKTVGVLGNRTGNTSDEVSDVKSPLSIKRNDITQLKKEARTRLDTIDPYSSEAVELGSILNGSDTTTVLDTHNRAVETADEIPAMGSNAGGLSGNLPSSTSVTDVVVRGMLINVIDDIIYDKNPYRSNIALNRILRDMFYHDSTTGSAVNLLSTLPFSEFSLSGLKDEKMTSVFVDSLESMKINSLLPNMSIDYLVVGSAIVSLTYDEKIKRFTGSFPHNIDFAHFIQVPSYGIDPIIKVRLEPHIAGALNNPTIRDKYLNYIPKQIVEFYSQGGANGKGGGEGFELDPKTSIFIARNGTLRDFRGISLLKRAVPAWLYEKALIKGTLDQSYKRQRAIMHVTAGDGEEWIPLAEEMQAISNMFLAADLDPLGAIVVTRNGVNVNEVRQGQDFWRWDQNFDMIERIKLRSIGISESFVSGDACLSGDTLIPTEKGLLRIDEIGSEKQEDGHFHPINIKMGSRYGNEKASGWLYNGVKRVFEVTTNIGNKIKATGNHQVLVLRPNLKQDWVRVDELNEGDIMLAPTTKMVRETPLELNLSDPEPFYGNNVVVDSLYKPETMTPELAYILGAIISEGSICGASVYLPNSDIKFLKRISKYFDEVFGMPTSISLPHPKGTPYSINGNEGFTNKDCYRLYAGSKILVNWLNELGVDSRTAEFKEIPWCILQADQESQIAFAASYLEGDGSFGRKPNKINRKNNLTSGGGAQWISKSDKILDQFLAMFNSWGLTAGRSDRSVFIRSPEFRTIYPRFEKYMTSKKFNYSNRVYKCRNTYGVPMEWVKTYLRTKRFIKSDRYGSHYYDDDGDVVTTSYFNMKGDVKFLYDAYDNGKHDHYLSELKKVSLVLYRRLKELLDLRYNTAVVTSIKKLKKTKVYDISMGNKEPAFIANGLIVHNSYNSLEQTISVFMDQIRAYRNQFTSEIFYEKIFPMISEANGITKQRYGVKRGTEIASYGSSTAYRDEDNNIVASIGNSYPQVREFAAGSSANIDIRNFVVPEVLWHKRLMPEADEAYINMLGALHEKGLPITIRQWAAAGGMNLDNLMEDLNEDLRIREKIVDYRKAITDAMKAAGMGDEENDPGNSSQAFGEFASSRSSLERAVDQLVSEKFNIGSVRKKALLSYGDPEHPNAQFSDRDSKGNRRVMTKQGRDIMANRFTKNLAKAAAEMAKQENARIKDENWQTDQRINKKKYYHGK